MDAVVIALLVFLSQVFVTGLIIFIYHKLKILRSERLKNLIHWHPVGGFDHACGDQEGDCREEITSAHKFVDCPICRKALLQNFPIAPRL